MARDALLFLEAYHWPAEPPKCLLCACFRGLKWQRLLHTCSLHQDLSRTTFASGALLSL